MALSNKRTAAVERLLSYWPPGHELPLYPAIHLSFPDGVRLLLAHGADYRAIDSFGEGILHWLAGSGLEMLRLFKGFGVTGVNVEMTDNKGKTAVEIMEGRWDLTEEFRMEFMELLDGSGEMVEVGEVLDEDLSQVEDEDIEVAVVEDLDQDLLEEIFFDAVDGSTYTEDVPEGQFPLSPLKEMPSFEPDRAQSPDCWDSGIRALSPVAAQQNLLHRNYSGGECHDEKASLESELDTADASETQSMSGGLKMERLESDKVDHGNQPEQKYPGSPNAAEFSDKVLTDEAGLKFLGTSAALRGQ